MTKSELAKYIDHTNLKPTATKEDIAELCDEANKYGFYSVCVNPRYVEFAKEYLADMDSKVKVATVVGFPLGENTQEIKTMEAVMAYEAGADELDMVMSISALKSKDYEYVSEEIRRIVDVCDIPVKVILETCKLTNEEIVKACEIAAEAGAAFVKTSTGYAESGATAEVVKLMADTVAGVCEVKASGGIRNLESMIDMICAGATRIGTSSGVEIIQEFVDKKKKK